MPQQRALYILFRVLRLCVLTLFFGLFLGPEKSANEQWVLGLHGIAYLGLIAASFGTHPTPMRTRWVAAYMGVESVTLIVQAAFFTALMVASKQKPLTLAFQIVVAAVFVTVWVVRCVAWSLTAYGLHERYAQVSAMSFSRVDDTGPLLV